MKTPFVTKDQLEAIAAQYPTPFHIYDEQGIRENARRLRKAFAWNPGYREYFAVKAAPTPALLKLLHEEGCGCDCSSMTELMISERCGITGENIMFSSNDTPAEEFQMADRLGAIINLDDLTLVDYLERSIGHVPEKICCRYNPGGVFTLGETREGFQVMDNPGDAKYGMTRAQIAEAFTRLSAMGAKEFGIHAFLASNTLSNDYYPALARILFQLAAELKAETGVHITFINLSGGVGIPYRPEQPANDIAVIGEGVRRAYEEVLVPAGMGDVALYTELGRFMTGPYGHLVTRAIHEKHIYKEYIGVDACACNLMRPAMYGSYHHITVMGKEDQPCDHRYDVTGALCENIEKFAVDRNARRPRRLLPPQTRQIGAVRPFCKHCRRRGAPRSRTAVPGHGLLPAPAGKQLCNSDRASRRTLCASGQSRHLRGYDRRQPRPEYRLRAQKLRRAPRGGHPPCDGARQPLRGAGADLGIGRRPAQHRPAGTLPPTGRQPFGHMPVRRLPALRQPLFVGVRRLLLSPLPDGRRKVRLVRITRPPLTP